MADLLTWAPCSLLPAACSLLPAANFYQSRCGQARPWPVLQSTCPHRRLSAVMNPIDLRYTLCFLIHAEHILMLKRERPPNRGLWNGVGGKIEPGETPVDACLREVEEETGFRVQRLRFLGIMTWEGFEIPPGGLYLFSAPAPEGPFRGAEEGLLRWWHKRWVFSSAEVVDNIHIFGPAMFANLAPRWWHFCYDHGTIRDHQVRNLPAWVRIGGYRACCPKSSNTI